MSGIRINYLLTSGFTAVNYTFARKWIAVFYVCVLYLGYFYKV